MSVPTFNIYNMKHKHHIIPKHMGGTNDIENLIELTIEEHAERHRLLYEIYGKWQDYCAWKGLSNQIGKEEILKIIASECGKKAFQQKLGIFAMSKEERLPFIKKGGKVVGDKNAKSGRCAEIANLGGKSSAGMRFWYNQITNKETRSFESPGENWIEGIKMDRINLNSLKKNSSNTKGSFWIYNPETNESKMVFNDSDIPYGFIKGRNIKIENTVELLNVGDNSNIKLKKVKSEYSNLRFDNSYKRWIFEFNNQKITHIDYYSLVWARDCLINYYKLGYKKSNLDFNDSYSKDEIVKILKSFREYLKIKKILSKKIKKSRTDAYRAKLDIFEPDYNLVSEKLSKFMWI